MKMWNSNLFTKIKQQQTPFYLYNLGLLKKTLEILIRETNKYGYNIHYALKANSDNRVLKTICDFNLGADCVSGNEILRALELGFPSQKIMFAGVGKTDNEILIALKNNIGCFNCESEEEIEVINQLAGKLNKKAPIALRINPDVESNTHEYVTTGKEYNKFGISLADIEQTTSTTESCENINLIGLHFHIGSQITDLTVYKNLCEQVNKIEKSFYDRGINVQIINLGGGLGIDYDNPNSNLIPDFEAFFKIIYQSLNVRFGQTVHFELGRAIVGQMGNLVSKALFVKKSGNKEFAIIDAGMTELIRPALYRSYHKIENLSKKFNGNMPYESYKYDVVGPICESSDYLGKNVTLPKTERGDIIAIRSVGAYAESMSSNYNLRDKAKVVYFE